MLWEELRSGQFSSAIKESGGVCLLPIGCLEKHGNHLPVATDMYIGQAISKRAAEMETSVVFPYYFLGEICTARHWKGTVAASHRLKQDALLEMCDEIYRNGFNKIIIVSSHGANRFFLPYFAQEMLRLDRKYTVYIYSAGDISNEQRSAILEAAKASALGGHAGLLETALIMHLRPDLVDLSAVNPGEYENQNRLANLKAKGVFTGFNWYADYPNHFAGDPGAATAELGKMIFNIKCGNLTEVISAVKADEVSEKLIQEFTPAGQNPV